MIHRNNVSMSLVNASDYKFIIVNTQLIQMYTIVSLNIVRITFSNISSF